MSESRKVRQFAMQHPVAVREDWETPPEFFAQYDREFGFTLDVCATPANAKCARYFTPEQNGLAQVWHREVCWMNPPYGREIPKWMEKAWIASQCESTVVCLVPARTDTRWWHAYAEQASERRFVKGRIKFVGAKHNAPFPCAVVVFRPDAQQKAAMTCPDCDGRGVIDDAYPCPCPIGRLGLPLTSRSPDDPGQTASCDPAFQPEPAA